MPQLPQSRKGEILLIKKRPVSFSKWPSRPGRVHNALQSLIFARDPWLLISQSINRNCVKSKRPEALAYVEQATDFFTAAVGGNIIAARPLALYYSFMNLAKAFSLTNNTHSTFDQARHGLHEGKNNGTKEFIDAVLTADPTMPNSYLQNFDEFKRALTGKGLPGKVQFSIPRVTAQIVPGHRFWSIASKKPERFIAVHDLKFRHDHGNRLLWLELYFVADDLSRLGVSRDKFLKEARLDGDFREVACSEALSGRPLLRFEQLSQTPYPNGYAADEIRTAIAPIRDLLWATVTTAPPYRKYYAYMAPQAEHSQILPQLLSIYAVMFYLGSITRYRPHQFDSLLVSSYGGWIQEFVSGQPLQFLYLLASEFARQDVARPAIL